MQYIALYYNILQYWTFLDLHEPCGPRGRGTAVKPCGRGTASSWPQTVLPMEGTMSPLAG